MKPSHKSTMKRTTRTKKVIENDTMKGLEVKIQLKQDIKIMQQKRRSVPFLLQQSVEKKTKNEKTMSLRKVQQDGNVPSRRHILGSKIFKEQLLEKFGKKFFFKKKI